METLKEEYVIIAVFMGYEITSGGMIIDIDGQNNRWARDPQFKNYLGSWDELMEVVRAIESFQKVDGQSMYDVIIERDQCSIRKYKRKDDVVLCVGGPSKISRVYSCVLEFIKLVT